MRWKPYGEEGWNGQQTSASGNRVDEARSESHGDQNDQGKGINCELKHERH